MNFEEKNKSYPENNGQNFVSNNQEELMHSAENMYNNNKSAVKKGCGTLIVIGIAIFIGINMLASVLEPYAPLNEDGDKDSFNFALAACIGFAMTVISLYAMIKKIIRCSKKVTADVIGKQASGNNMYKTVYEYYFDGKIYRTESQVSVAKVPKTNYKTTLHINPNNPQEIFDKGFLLFLIGILIMGLFILSSIIFPILSDLLKH